jgi:hypothetical protein
MQKFMFSNDSVLHLFLQEIAVLMQSLVSTSPEVGGRGLAIFSVICVQCAGAALASAGFSRENPAAITVMKTRTCMPLVLLHRESEPWLTIGSKSLEVRVLPNPRPFAVAMAGIGELHPFEDQPFHAPGSHLTY